MNKMAANARWYPYKQLVTKRELNMSINFGDIQIEYPSVSHALGFYKKSKYEFDWISFEDLLNDLVMWYNIQHNKD